MGGRTNRVVIYLMGLASDIDATINEYLSGNYETWEPRGVPEPEDIKAGKHAAKLTATTLFIDVRQSSDITNAFRLQTAAKMMKAYFSGAVRIINYKNGKVRSFNGDGMLAVFVGGRRSNNAVEAAKLVQGFVIKQLRPRIARYFAANRAAGTLGFHIGCGIDDGDIFAVKVGIKGTNDIAWVGRGTNAAAKLASKLSSPENIGVTADVYARLNKSNLTLKSTGEDTWSAAKVMSLGGVLRTVRTTHWYRIPS
jgi:uridylate cyclase